MMRPSPLLRGTSLWAPVVVLMAGIGYLSVRPIAVRPAVPHSDKVAHVTAYAVLTLALARALGGGSPLTAGDAALVALAWSAGFGAALEVAQRFLPNRTADLLDVVANVAGAVLAGAGWWAVARRRAARRRGRAEGQ